MNVSNTIHATSVVFCGRGLLLCGPSGSGKSDLALRIMDAGGSLIADDYTALDVKDGKIFASPPLNTAGLMEVRGVGILKTPYIKEARIDAAIECAASDKVERLPEPATLHIDNLEVPLWRIGAFEASAVAKIRALLQCPKVES